MLMLSGPGLGFLGKKTDVARAFAPLRREFAAFGQQVPGLPCADALAQYQQFATRYREVASQWAGKGDAILMSRMKTIRAQIRTRCRK
jgi:hypothetical protein